MPDLRQIIAQPVRDVLGARAIDLTRPPGDDGLFGPGSASWQVHGDFTAMMIGGVASLLTQMLHPGALGGVWDHSNFRRDMLGRLQRTAAFISVTTFGSTANAEAAIARVRRIHDVVTGTLPDGSRYAANDPALLTWVHAVEADSFLRAHLLYRDPSFAPARQDRYLAEMADLARRLGAEHVPASRAELTRYFRAVQPELRADARTREVARVLVNHRVDKAAAAPINAVILQAGVDLLPDWAARLHGFRRPAGARPALRLAASGMGSVLRWALTAPKKASV